MRLIGEHPQSLPSLSCVSRNEHHRSWQKTLHARMTGADLLHNFRGLRGIPVSPVKAAVSHCIFLRQLQKGVLQQCEEVNQERKSSEFQKIREPTQTRGKGNFQDDGEGKLLNNDCEVGVDSTKKFRLERNLDAPGG